jgi:hypothetical protein
MAVAEASRQRFLDLLGAEHADCYPHFLDRRFPHIVEFFAENWGGWKLDEYFMSLMVPSRPGRQGFPEEAAKEIFRLFTLHHELRSAKLAGFRKSAGWELTDDGGIDRR